MSREFYREVQGAVFVYDITNRVSFTNLRGWYEKFVDYSDDFRDAVGRRTKPALIVAGNKTDLTV